MSAFHPARRGFLGAVGASLFATPGLFADQLMRTPPETEGPFYPDKLPLDTDNDLIVVNDALTPAVGEITHLTGRILGPDGSPVPNAVVEIWQCDANGVYIHTRDSTSKAKQQDKNFQGFGRFATGRAGAYYFRTIKPVPYPGRTPHIHVKVKRGGKELLVTQLFVAGHSGNAADGVYRGVRSPIGRELMSASFDPVKGSKVGELAANFDIVLGRTPDEATLEQTRPTGR